MLYLTVSAPDSLSFSLFLFLPLPLYLFLSLSVFLSLSLPLPLPLSLPLSLSAILRFAGDAPASPLCLPAATRGEDVALSGRHRVRPPAALARSSPYPPLMSQERSAQLSQQGIYFFLQHFSLSPAKGTFSPDPLSFSPNDISKFRVRHEMRSGV